MSEYISFPDLGWKFEISENIVTIGNLEIKWYGALIALGMLLALVYSFRRAKDFKIDENRMIDVVLVSIVFSIIGARLYYIMFSPEMRSSFFENPLVFFEFRKGGLAVYGGIILAFIAALVMCKIRKVDVLSLFDLAGICLLIGQGIGRWGNFFNQEAFGTNTSLPWGMSGSKISQGTSVGNYDPALPVHPTFLYESLWCALGFVLLHFLSKKKYAFKGQIISMYMIWYGIGRFLIEGLRTDQLKVGQIAISQLVAVVSVIAGIIMLLVLRSAGNRSPIDLFATNTGLTDVLSEDDVETIDEEDKNVSEKEKNHEEDSDKDDDSSDEDGDEDE